MFSELKNTPSFIKEHGKFIILLLALLPISFVVLNSFPAIRVGDGSEYYALFFSWLVEFRPWMTNEAYELYQELVSSNDVIGNVSAEALQNTFHLLTVGNTSDYNHFWLYSFLAFLAYTILSIFMDVNVHEAFIFLHVCLLLVPIYYSYSLYRWKGIAVTFILIISSPILWYVSKVHTEWFTFCLTLSAVITFSANRYFISSLLFAVASTQNISFALVAFIPFFIGVLNGYRKGYSLNDVIMIVSIALVTFLHPIYYFFRYGVVSPQFLAGGANIEPDLLGAYIWLFDFDVGLFPNWLLGAFVFLLFIVINKGKFKAGINYNKHYLIFLFLFLLVNLYAHSSTQNINSGATPGVSRYALWYIPLLFSPFLYVLNKIILRKNKLVFLFGFLFTVPMIYLNVALNQPNVVDTASSPSISSLFLQTEYPKLYHPHPEIFIERFSGFGELISVYELYAIIGPDCLKVLVLNEHKKGRVVSPKKCFYDQNKLESLFYNNKLLESKSITLKQNNKFGFDSSISSEYILLNHSIKNQLKMKFRSGNYKINTHEQANKYILGFGWGALEDWGVWSDKKSLELRIPCIDEVGLRLSEKIKLNLILRPFTTQNITISIENESLLKETLDIEKNIDVYFNSSLCRGDYVSVNINVSNPISPKELGLSNDARTLAIGLSEFTLSKGM